MDITLLHRLLAEGESSRLDYKSEQYRFSGANVEHKAELLKDILAMANAWRDTDAYILIGVREASGRKPEVMGISDHLDDADVQEFVNQKTNRPIHFSYVTFDVGGKSIGIIHVPLQTRPFFLRKRFGPLDPGIVYLRRGSSTDTADADEIHSMGASFVSGSRPSLAVQFAEPTRRDLLGTSVSLRRTLLRPLPDDKLPLDPQDHDTVMAGGIPMPVFTLSRANANYWRELREYLCIRNITASIGFAVTNTSSVVATGVSAKLTTPEIEEMQFFEHKAERPRYRFDHSVASLPDVSLHSAFRDASVDFTLRGGTWHVEITFGKVQPRATVWTDNELVIGIVDKREVVLTGSIFGDNFDPIPLELRIDSDPTVRPMTLEELKAEHNREGDGTD
jgi:hypothetical protein